MKLLADQDVYQATVEFLRQAGFDVVTARDMGLEGSSDIHLLRVAYREKRVLLTRDKGFGSLVFLAGARTWGVILLRGLPSELDAVHRQLLKALETTGDRVCRSFCVVGPRSFRVRQRKEP